MNDLRMPDVNTVLIAGNLTRDPSFRRTTNGTPVANFWIASNRKFKDNTGQWRESVCYVGVVAWYKLAETCAENLRRGCAVLIEGELQSRSLRSDDGRNRNIVEIKARRIQFLNKRDESEEDEHDLSEHLDDLTDEAEDDESIEQEPQSLAKPVETSKEEKNAPTEKPDADLPQQEENNPMKGKFDFGYQDL
jgi:single-strand DNA-binding protein